jgi:hypothetical protein
VEAAAFAVVDRVTGKDPWWSVYTTGHSLGGALSTAAAEGFATRHSEYAALAKSGAACLRDRMCCSELLVYGWPQAQPHGATHQGSDA